MRLREEQRLTDSPLSAFAAKLDRLAGAEPAGAPRAGETGSQAGPGKSRRAGRTSARSRETARRQPARSELGAVGCRAAGSGRAGARRQP